MVRTSTPSKSYFFGAKSLKQLATAHVDLQEICFTAIRDVNFSVLEGYRSNDRQARLYADGKTKIKSGGMHNVMPSNAVDLLPYPAVLDDRLIWEDYERFAAFGGFIKGIGFAKGIPLRWGADWDNDWNHREHRFLDFPHFERVLP